MKRLLIVADDLAGAADCGVVFAQRGLRTWAALEASAVADKVWDVLALDTDTRDETPSDAHERVDRALAPIGAEATIYKKIDSTLRGNVAAELRAVVAQRSADCVIAAPVLPATGRMTVNGQQLLKGRPLEESDLGLRCRRRCFQICSRLPSSGWPRWRSTW